MLTSSSTEGFPQPDEFIPYTHNCKFFLVDYKLPRAMPVFHLPFRYQEFRQKLRTSYLSLYLIDLNLVITIFLNEPTAHCNGVYIINMQQIYGIKTKLRKLFGK